MITILHGDHEVKISDEVSKVIQLAQQNGASVVRLQAKKMTLNDLETALGMNALFATKKIVIIDNLFSLPKSKTRDTFISQIAAHDAAEVDLFLIEKKALTATQLKYFTQAKQQLFKYPALLFTWLESIGVVSPAQSITMFHQILEREEEQFIFIMLARQIRMLLAFVCDGSYDGPPFLRGKLASQARHFTKEKLLSLHSALLALDENQKASQLSMTPAANLDLILSIV